MIMTDNVSPLVTISIPTYNRADAFLRQSITSALNQTYKNIEVLVSDNASTDDTKSVIKSISDKRIKYHRHSQNIGANNNFNACVELARGDYFVLLPDDDLLDHDFVSSCLKAVDKQPGAGVIFTGTRVIDGDGSVLSESLNRGQGLSTADFFLGWFSNKFPLYLCSTLFHTQSLRSIGGFHSKTNVFQDVVAEARLVANFGYANVHDVKASFRRHAVNRGGATERIRDWCQDSLYLLDVICHLTPTERRSEVMDEGLKWFCKKNYILSASIDSFFRRWRMYLEVYKDFKYSYSPLSYIRERELNRLRRIHGKLL
jgi:glycosyltransferase involved in cell wall biosynthesis